MSLQIHLQRVRNRNERTAVGFSVRGHSTYVYLCLQAMKMHHLILKTPDTGTSTSGTVLTVSLRLFVIRE